MSFRFVCVCVCIHASENQLGSFRSGLQTNITLSPASRFKAIFISFISLTFSGILNLNEAHQTYDHIRARYGKVCET